MSLILEIASWSSFKQTCITTKNLNCQYEEAVDRYELYGPDTSSLLWHTSILKSDPRNADQVDFEDNHKAAFNWAIGNRPYPFSTPDFIYNGSGVLATATKNSTTAIDFLIPGALGTFQYINGAEVITQNAVFGDWASSQIIDVDNVLGYGINTVLSSYIQKWYINPNQALNLTTQYAGKVPAGTYVRVSYHSVGLITDVGVALNFKLHTPL